MITESLLIKEGLAVEVGEEPESTCKSMVGEHLLVREGLRLLDEVTARARSDQVLRRSSSWGQVSGTVFVRGGRLVAAELIVGELPQPQLMLVELRLDVAHRGKVARALQSHWRSGAMTLAEVGGRPRGSGARLYQFPLEADAGPTGDVGLAVSDEADLVRALWEATFSCVVRARSLRTPCADAASQHNSRTPAVATPRPATRFATR